MGNISSGRGKLDSAVISVAILIIGGAGLTLDPTSALDVLNGSSDFDTSREIGVGLLTGGLVGVALLIIDERRESRRDEHDADLSASQRRHTLAVALAIKEDLREICLANQDLQGVVLVGRDLRGADLVDVDFRDAQLGLVDFTDAALGGSNLESANLSGSQLTETDLSSTNLRSSNLAGVVMTNASLADADLSSANLAGATLSFVLLTGADLSEARNLEAAQFENVLWDPSSPPQWPVGFATPTNAWS
ncbi:MAG: pentapeptide repeat-containing protein [Actinomycetota bacterium]